MNDFDYTGRFDDQVAIVAGGARGIGKGIALRLSKEGAHVAVFDVRQKELEELSMENEDLNLSFHCIDITDENAIKNLVDAVVLKEGRVDIMINCVGIVGSTSTKIGQYETSEFDKVMEVNLKGAFLLTKYSIRQMLKNNYGRILHMTSIGGKEGNPGMVGYAASKSGLIGLIKGVGKEFAETGITVNGLAPAVIATEFNESTNPETLQYMIDKIPMKRLGTVEEVAAIACWIVSKEASFNTGFVFDLSGGRATY